MAKNGKMLLAGCVIQDDSGRILLLHRNTARRTQWELPGGKVEESELPKNAAIREAKEEVGIDVEVIRKLGNKDFLEDSLIFEYIWYLAEIKFGTPLPMEEKFDKVQFFSLLELQQIDSISPNVRNLLNSIQTSGIVL